MRNLLGILCISCILFATAESCSKSNSSNYAPGMTALVNDSAFAVTDPSQIVADSASSGSLTYLYISGDDPVGQVIKISIVGAYTANTIIQFGKTNASAYYYPTGITNPYSQAVSGSVTFTATTPTLSGTFSFTCADGTKVTNGAFSVLAP